MPFPAQVDAKTKIAAINAVCSDREPFVDPSFPPIARYAIPSFLCQMRVMFIQNRGESYVSFNRPLCVCVGCRSIGAKDASLLLLLRIAYTKDDCVSKTGSGLTW